MTTTTMSNLDWLRRRASALLVLMGLAIIFVAVLGAMRIQGHPVQTAAAEEAANPAISRALVAQAEWQARAEDAVEYSVRAHQAAIEAAPALTLAQWQARAEDAVEHATRAHEAAIATAPTHRNP